MDTQRLPHGTIRIHCECCGLDYVVRDRDGAVPTICKDCYGHRGPLHRQDRAESHEAMLCGRLADCQASEKRAQKARAAARDKMIAAFEARNYLADRLVRAAEGSCSRNCPARQLAREPDVAEFARQHRER